LSMMSSVGEGSFMPLAPRRGFEIPFVVSLDFAVFLLPGGRNGRQEGI
jgi:hypothetical protein